MDYHLALILATSLGIYFLSWLGAKLKIISLMTHRKIWNWILALFFFISAALGLLLALSLEYKINLHGYRNYLWIHVETGIVMASIGLMHFIWHFKYYLNCFKKNK